MVSMASSRFDIAVVGSLNTDMVLGVAAFPAPGETLVATRMQSGAGGKGLNQAVAAARAGARTAMIGLVGSDERGQVLLDTLGNDGIDISAVKRVGDRPTGLATILVRDDGQNMIVVASGANAAALPAGPIDAAICLASLETAVEGVEAALHGARAAGSLCLLNAAPARAEAIGLFALADLIIVNETELEGYAGASLPMVEAARSLITHEEQTIIVTLGADGVLAVDRASSRSFAAPVVKAVDATGAGDCFCGVLAAALARQAPLGAAIEEAIAAAALAVQRHGAADALPYRAEIDDALAKSRLIK